MDDTSYSQRNRAGAENMLAAFEDMPEPSVLKAVINSWYRPEAPSGLAPALSSYLVGPVQVHLIIYVKEG